MNLFASPWTWASAATAMSRPIATANSVAGGRGAAAGGAAASPAGSGARARTPAQPDELFPARVLPHAHQQSGRAEEAAADLEVPAGMSAAPQHARAVRPQALLHRAQPLVLLLPALAPDRAGHGPKRRRPRGPAAP